MYYTYRYLTNKESILEALSDLEGFFDNNLIEIDSIQNWVNLYRSLHSDCMRDRYFNSCFTDFPCRHTEKNIEYQFSMLYCEFKDVAEWGDANKLAKLLLPRLLSVAPCSLEEQKLISCFEEDFKSILFEINNREIKNGTVDMRFNYMNFGDFQLATKGLEDLISLSQLHWKIIWN